MTMKSNEITTETVEQIFLKIPETDPDNLVLMEESVVSSNSDNEQISTQHSSLISDKYCEDMNAKTVANKIASMIIDMEESDVMKNKREQNNPDPDF